MNDKKIIPSAIFYMGNKYKLLKHLLPLFPKECDIFYDLFGGSAVVSLNYKGKYGTFYNDFNSNITELVKMFKYSNPQDLDKYFTKTIKNYNIISAGKDYRDKKGFDKGYYEFRKYYNECKEKNIKDVYLLSCYSMNHLMRFNQKNEFNASVGSTQRYIYEKIEKMQERLENVNIFNENIFDIDLSHLTENDFVYLDPPYLNTTAVYNEKKAFGGWSKEDDYKLFDILDNLEKRNIKWGLSNVYENRGVKNDHLIKWCEVRGWWVKHLSRNYNPFSRGNSNNDEVYICNYKLEGE